MTIGNLTRFSPMPQSGGEGDTGQLMQKNSAAPTDPALGSIHIGAKNDGTVVLNYAGFWRFEVTVPSEAIIHGIALHLVAGTTRVGDDISVNGGFMQQQGESTGWEGSAGVAEWLIDTDIPLVHFNTVFGPIFDLTVYHGGAAAFTDVVADTQPFLTPFVLAEGTLDVGNSPAPTTVSGMMAKLTSYLAANEDTRGDTSPGAIPTLFQLHQDYAQTPQRYQSFYTQNHIEPDRHPFMDVDWSLAKGASGEVDLIEAVRGVPDVLSAVSGTVGLLEAVSGVPDVTESVTGSESLTEAVSGDADLI